MYHGIEWDPPTVHHNPVTFGGHRSCRSEDQMFFLNMTKHDLSHDLS